MSKVVVTGAGGFIGAYMTRSLLAQGHSVVAVDNYIRGMPSRLDGLQGDAERVDLDVRDKGDLVSLPKGVDAGIHLAVVKGTENLYKRTELALDGAERGPLQACEGCVADSVSSLG